jgi:hypothetical protein
MRISKTLNVNELAVEKCKQREIANLQATPPKVPKDMVNVHVHGYLIKSLRDFLKHP